MAPKNPPADGPTPSFFDPPSPQAAPDKEAPAKKAPAKKRRSATSPAATTELDRPAMPSRLSPSRMSDYMKCPKAFWYRSILRLPSAPTVATTRGTLTHTALEELFAHPRSERTEECAVSKILPAWEQMKSRADYAGVVSAAADEKGKLTPELLAAAPDETFPEVDPAKEKELLDSVEVMVRNYFKIERPQAFDPAGLELRLTADIGGVAVHGIIDRLDEHVSDAGTRMFVSDYKGLAVDTPLPTPSGWTTMGEVQVGDELLGSDGNPCTVTVKSDIHNRPCYQIIFDDGSTIVCDNVHLWTVMVSTGESFHQRTVDADTLFALSNDPAVSMHIPNCLPITRPDAELPIDPYVLGSDLGHIPESYLRASIPQRLMLLQGLMDSQGHWESTSLEAVFTSKDRALAAVVHELVCTLGAKARVVAPGEADHPGSYQVIFSPHGFVPFGLVRKGETVPSSTSQSPMRAISSMSLMESVPTQCVKVDSPDSLYLAGRQMVPTHNTGKLPRERFLDDAFFAMKIYAVLVEEALGKSVHSLRLLYLVAGSPKGVYTLEVNETLTELTRTKVKAIADSIKRSWERDEWPTKTGPLCNWCDFQPICPAFNHHAEGLGIAMGDSVVGTKLPSPKRRA